MTTATIDSSFPAPTRVPVTSKKKLQGKDVGVPVRKMGLSYGEDMPTLLFNDNAFLTMLFTGFSATLPEGEAQFIFQHKVKTTGFSRSALALRLSATLEFSPPLTRWLLRV